MIGGMMLIMCNIALTCTMPIFEDSMCHGMCNGFGPMGVATNSNQPNNFTSYIDGIKQLAFLFIGTSLKVSMARVSMMGLVLVSSVPYDDTK